MAIKPTAVTSDLVDGKIAAALVPTHKLMEAQYAALVASQSELKEATVAAMTKFKDAYELADIDLNTRFENVIRAKEIEFAKFVSDVEMGFKRQLTLVEANRQAISEHAGTLAIITETTNQVVTNVNAITEGGKQLVQQVNDLRDEIENLREMQTFLEARVDKAMEHSFTATRILHELGQRAVLKGQPDWWTIGINTATIGLIVFLFAL